MCLQVITSEYFLLCTDLAVDIASATVSVGRMTGIPDPRMTVDDKAPNFPVVSYRYFISYVFLRHQTPAHSVTYPSHTFEFFSISISLDVFKCFGPHCIFLIWF